MRTNLKVNAETNGTLKMNRKSMITSFLAGFGLMLVATAGMSFTSEDTSRATDSSVKSAITKAVANDKGELAKFMPATLTARRADMVMDAYFRINESKNRKLAVAFTKMMNSQAVDADAIITERFTLNTLVPAYTKDLSVEIETADATMDVKLNEEAEVKAKTSAYKTGLNNQVNAADLAMDVMMNVTTIKQVKPAVAVDADKQMDTLLNGKNITPAIAVDADSKLDALFNKQ
jgi:hypothetical protein